tara:strand:- start:570 stop:1628 length:1059 start_codon:yes stop_codon:yes gene_type:complete
MNQKKDIRKFIKNSLKEDFKFDLVLIQIGFMFEAVEEDAIFLSNNCDCHLQGEGKLLPYQVTGFPVSSIEKKKQSLDLLNIQYCLVEQMNLSSKVDEDKTERNRVVTFSTIDGAEGLMFVSDTGKTKKINNHGKKWTEEEDKKLSSLMLKEDSYKDLSSMFGRTPLAIELRIRRLKILQILEERNITKLVHFTDVWNAFYIGKYGILSKEELEKQNIKHSSNDDQRLDNMDNFISLSVTNINKYVLKDFNNRNKRQWIKLYIDPKVILSDGVYFFYTNAASKVFPENKEIDQFSSPGAFEKMFDGEIKTSTKLIKRSVENRNLNEPTCIQSEIMIKKRITRDNIIDWEEVTI